MNSLLLKVKSFPEVSETWMFSIIKQAKAKNINVVVFTDTIKKTTNTGFDTQVTVLSEHDYSQLASRQRKLKAIKIAFSNPKLIYFYWKYTRLKGKQSLDYIFRLFSYLKYRKVDVCHVHFANATTPLDDLKAIGFMKGNLIVTCHGYDVHFSNEAERLRLQELYKNAFFQANLITVNGAYLYDKVVAISDVSAKTRIVNIAADESIFTPKNFPKQGHKEGVVKLISVGRLAEIKGHRFAIKMVAQLIALGYNVIYRIFGEGKERHALEELISSQKLENHVILEGSKPQCDIAKFMEDSHIFIMSSITDSNNRAEAQGLVLAEAQLMGLPIVAFDSGGVKNSTSPSTTILVPEKDCDAMANAVVEMISDERRFIEMSENARSFAQENFSSQKMFESYYNTL